MTINMNMHMNMNKYMTMNMKKIINIGGDCAPPTSQSGDFSC